MGFPGLEFPRLGVQRGISFADLPGKYVGLPGNNPGGISGSSREKSQEFVNFRLLRKSNVPCEMNILHVALSHHKQRFVTDSYKHTISGGSAL